MELEQVGPYRIERKIGSGGMGTVYLAKHSESGDEVALKVLPPALARQEGFVKRFEREIESLETLVNPHIVTLLDHGKDHNTYYYAMDFVDGETLTERLRREKRIPWRDAARFGVQICAALKSAHDAGIVHRDLKPSNLLLDDEGNVKLTDFGVAQVFAAGRLTMTGGIIGTAEYMSPEQAFGKRATHKSDLYSLGAVMFTMLTGRPPFTGKSTLDVIHKHKYGTYDRPSRFVEGIPRKLEEIVCQLLEKDPEKRLPDALVLSRKLDEILTRAAAADQDETRIADTRPTGNGQTRAVRMGGTRVSSGQVGGTLMRDLMRAEIERTHAASPLGRFLDNTWVLLLLFGLVVGGGIYLFNRTPDEPEVSSTEDRKTETRKILKAKLVLENLLKTEDLSERDSLFRKAIVALETGEIQRAAALVTLLQNSYPGDDAKPEVIEKLAEVRGLLAEIQSLREAIPPEEALLLQLMERAKDLRLSAAKQPTQEEAERAKEESSEILRGIVELYDGQDEYREIVRSAKTRLERLKYTEGVPKPTRPDSPDTDEPTDPTP